MTGQARKDPFHVNRDVVRDNLAIVRKLRLVRGAQIRARQQFATVDNGSSGASVEMPYTGTLCLTVDTGGNDIIINNPFVRFTPLPITPVVLNSAPGASTISVTSAGQITLTGGGIGAGPYKIVVGTATDAVNNNFSQ